MSELTAHYPNTAFIGEVVPDMDPLGVDLVRAVCLAQHFGQSDPTLTTNFAAISAGEVAFWLPDEKRKYPQIRADVSRFFRGDGVAQLTEASMQGVEGDDAASVRTDKSQFLARSWEVFRDNLPTYDELREQKPAHQAIKEGLKHEPLPTTVSGAFAELGEHVRILKWQRYLGRFFMMVDTESVRAGRRPGMFDADPHESMVREAVLSRPSQTTGSAIFNLIFTRMQESSVSGGARAELRELKRAWTKHHPGEKFIPPVYQEAVDERALGDRVASRVWNLFTR